MGVPVERGRYSRADYARFGDRLRLCVQALGHVLQRPGFGEGEATVGAELEMFLVGARGEPALVSADVLESAADPRLTVELDRFNVECNTAPTRLAGYPFSALRHELESGLAAARKAAARYGTRVAVVGILPTLRAEHLSADALCDIARYRALARSLRRRKGTSFEFHIDGPEPLHTTWDNVAPEGANTSLQIHLRVAPESFSRLYNAVQLATAPVLAASGNSPTFLGHRLWEETRVALFKQAVDERPRGSAEGRRSRVGFGTRWIEEGALELFSESVSEHAPLIPQVSDECPLTALGGGGLPKLWELRLHASTVWLWNRPVYDPGGHLRIEMRALPAGPTVTDMLANSAFLVGLAHALQGSSPWQRLPFEQAHDNFYRAAQHGLEATLHWPGEGGVAEVKARELLPELVALAEGGLAQAGVQRSEFAPLLEVFAERVASGQTGARWQHRQLEALLARFSRDDAYEKMTQSYLANSESDVPVHRWPVSAGSAEGASSSPPR